MDLIAQRLFIFFDEWLWVALCLYLANRWTERMSIDSPKSAERTLWRRLFWTALIAGAVMNYGVGYGLFFMSWWRS